MRILVTNDDGWDAPGLAALKTLARHLGEVFVLAPRDPHSYAGHRVTTDCPLVLGETGAQEFTLTGTPADCTQIGMYELLHDKPAFVVSGINHGANIGHSYILSSGTVGAALEAGLQGIPAFASSVWRFHRTYGEHDAHGPETAKMLQLHAQITRQIIDKVMSVGFPAGVQVIAINVPDTVQPGAPWVITRPHRMHYGAVFSGDGQRFTNNRAMNNEVPEDPETDLAALLKGYVSIVPITVELTSSIGQDTLATILGVPRMNSAL